MGRLSSYLNTINETPALKRKAKQLQLIKSSARSLWIISILILLHQVLSSTGNSPLLTSLWAASLIASILLSSLTQKLSYNLALKAETILDAQSNN